MREGERANIWKRKAIAVCNYYSSIPHHNQFRSDIDDDDRRKLFLYMCSMHAFSLSIRNLYLRIFFSFFSCFLSPFLSVCICASLLKTHLVLLCLFSIYIATILEYFSFSTIASSFDILILMHRDQLVVFNE